MTIFNAEPYLHSAIDSVLAQSFKSFDILCIENGSTDDSMEILRSYSDPRINIVELKENIGRTAALNMGLRLSKAEFIAIQDADDIAYEDRLRLQLNHLDANPEIVMLGGNFDLIINEKTSPAQKVPYTHSDIITSMSHRCPFAHTTVMFRRKEVLELGGYPEEFIYSQDFAMYLNIMKKFCVANLETTIGAHRLHPAQLTGIQSGSELRLNEDIHLFKKAAVQFNYTGTSHRLGCQWRAELHLMIANIVHGKKSLSHIMSAISEAPLTSLTYLFVQMIKWPIRFGHRLISKEKA
ncbi:MAG: glycosyltransferase [Methylocystaceae bacterium]|nr:glycosyltransferase [Methylocystaceae bacterium]